MTGYDRVLCLCPAGRFYLAPLTLATWTEIRELVLTDNSDHELAGFSAVIVMDRFVTRELVGRLLRTLPVIVLAWNGQFEIDRYRALLPDDVTYMGTDASGPPGLAYLPTINGACSFARWQARYRDKGQFSIAGDAKYRMRWLRTRLYDHRLACVALSASAAVLKRPRSALATLQSAVLHDRLAWAGNCYYDPASLHLTVAQQARLDEAIAAMRASPSADARLEAGLALVEVWRAIGDELGASRAHETVYVTNTLLRWAVLGFLHETSAEATWFYGVDNVGLELPFELDIYNLVASRRMAFVDFGGKTSEALLYPRSLQLLARDCYVIAVSALSGDQRATVETIVRLRDELERRPREFFTELERRRRALFANVSPTVTLVEMQRRVWSDFSSCFVPPSARAPGNA